MALLTVSTESALTEAGNSVLISQVSGEIWLQVTLTLLGILRLQG